MVISSHKQLLKFDTKEGNLPVILSLHPRAEESIMSMKKVLLIATLIASITALHYFSSMADAPIHEFYRELYFIPAVLAGGYGGAG